VKRKLLISFLICQIVLFLPIADFVQLKGTYDPLPIKKSSQDKFKNDLIFPGLLKKEELKAGNPLATYAAMLELEQRYLSSEIFRQIYREIRLNFEEFLGFPLAGMQAMELIAPKGIRADKQTMIPNSFKAENAVEVIEREAQKTRIVIWAEEHHLPQTRSLYEELLKRLWKQGYRYLAAETFSDGVMKPDHKYPNYNSGYYTRDPVFASAVRTAKRLGYRLISYDTAERGEPNDASFRDRKQAENIKERLFDPDPKAKVLIIAGRGHASEKPASDGWIPMASVLKKLTGINPFTIYAPTMTQRLVPENEHPLYRDAVSRELVKHPVIFVNEEDNQILGPDFCDAYVFFPRSNFIKTRPDWMMRELGRKRVRIPKQFLEGKVLQLIQAFAPEEPNNAIPFDQIVIDEKNRDKVLMLPVGKFRLRAIDSKSVVHSQTNLVVR
jgi:hypothetical protein